MKGVETAMNSIEIMVKEHDKHVKGCKKGMF